MKRLGRADAAPISLILAFVFPAIIVAALALAYYGFQYADVMSQPIGTLFRDSARREAEKTITEFETRVDKPALALFDRLAAERADPADPMLASPCNVDPGVAIEAYVVLDEARKQECQWPQAAARKNDPYWKKLDWDSVKLGSWHHYHDLVEGHSVLVVYTPRKTDDGQRYYVAARLAMTVVEKQFLEEALGRLRAIFRVTIIDEDGGSISGSPLGITHSDREERFLFEDTFGKALYRWRVQIAPLNVDEFRTRAEQQRRLRPLLIVLSTTIIAVGLGIVWLVILGERRASRLKGDFIANVSHELKTPLSLIRMFGEMVATGRHKGEDAAREYGEIITRESERLSHLIDNVLDFARLERGKASYHFAEAEIADVVERALDVCRYRLEKEKLKLRTLIEPALPQVRMDENAMTLVILNLVDNAIKYGTDGGQVDVSVQRTPGGVVLGVRDYGPGIAREEQGRIFDRFYRARSARDRNVRGSGIGLALVKYIAEAHGGRATVESPVVGDTRPGSLFRVFLPAPIPEGSESAARHEIRQPLPEVKP
ncbi:MAG TPA: HAMP domain-containing sensor histidine kinase [Polyangia bacterium]|nr:HAMP domain-containing sensor histidine kinase [Polyangia bacterium]